MSSASCIRFALLLLIALPVELRAATRAAASATWADVNAAVHGGTMSNGVSYTGDAPDGDTVTVPAGQFTWTQTLGITKNILLLGAGEGKTVITEAIPDRSGKSPLINVTLSHDSPTSLSPYSFRLSGFTFQSDRTTGLSVLAADHGFITVVGRSTADTSPYVLGCVSRVRLDHLTMNDMNGIAFLIDSALGVADHITGLNTYGTNIMKVQHLNWTPAYRSDAGHVGEAMTDIAAYGFGSWADDSYWGSDKFWMWEDCSFPITITHGTQVLSNVCDIDGGARVVFRHCTVTGGGFAAHGMEGSNRTGAKQVELYNNDVDLGANKPFPNACRSGGVLFFNNRLHHTTNGLKFYTFRTTRYEDNFGGANGESRYDDNDTTVGTAGVIYSGTVTAVTSANGYPLASFSDSSKANFSSVTPGDGYYYVAENLNDLTNSPTANYDPGWQYHQSGIASVSGTTLNLLYEATTYKDNFGTVRPYSALWHVGDSYQIRRIRSIYGQPGQGKGKLLTAVSGSGISALYKTYFYPATSGTKATFPAAGSALDPAYDWNNQDVTNGLMNFNHSDSPYLLSGRDFFSKGDITPHTTQNVGYPATSYTLATANYPNIGPAGATYAYTPYTYPHPLQSGGTTTVSASITSAVTATFAAGATGNSFTVATANFTSTPAISLGSWSPSVTNVTLTDNGDGTATLAGTASGTAGGAHTVTITATAGGQTATQSFTLNVSVPNSPPACSLTASPAYPIAPAVITLTATASDADGNVVSYEFYDGNPATTGTLLPSQAGDTATTRRLTGITSGAHSYYLKVWDNAGAFTISSAASVNVAAGSGGPTPTPPTVIITP